MTSKAILVTGASRGIGAAISRQLIQEGHEVIGMARSFEWKHPKFTPILLDFSKIEVLSERLRALSKDISRLDALICNAGIGLFGHLEQFSFEQMREVMDVNFLSQAYVVKTFLPLMKRQKRGDVILMGSEAALQGKREGSLYCASKFALKGFAEAMREECVSSRVRVSLINPGMVQTGFFDQLDFEPKQYLLPQDVAQAVSYILSARDGVVFDEMNLAPLNGGIRRKTSLLKTKTDDEKREDGDHKSPHTLAVQ